MLCSSALFDHILHVKISYIYFRLQYLEFDVEQKLETPEVNDSPWFQFVVIVDISQFILNFSLLIGFPVEVAEEI